VQPAATGERERGYQLSAVRLIVSALGALVLSATTVLLGVSISLSTTILNSDFVIAELQDVPVYPIFAEEAKEQVPTEAAFLLPLIDEAEDDLEPWVREQVAVLVRSLETYVKGDMGFSATVSLKEPKRYLAERLEETLLDMQLPGLNTFTEEQQQLFLDQIQREVDARIPDSFEINEAYLDAGTLAGMRAAREFAGYVSTSLWLLPVVALMSVLIIAWMRAWRGRPVTRVVGAAFITAGIVSLIVRFVAPSAAAGMAPAYVPQDMRPALAAFIDGCFAPMFAYGIVVMLAGALLVLVSFRLRAADE
jgi:hypothetical protein